MLKYQILFIEVALKNVGSFVTAVFRGVNVLNDLQLASCNSKLFPTFTFRLCRKPIPNHQPTSRLIPLP